MSNSDSEAKKAQVMLLLAAYQVEATKAMLVAWSVGVDGLTSDQVAAAVRQVLQGDYPHLPRPGEVRALALGGVRDLDEEAELAWAELDQALNNSNTGPLPDRVKQVVKQMGGGSYLMKLSMRDFGFKRSQFLKLFKAGAKSAPAQIGSRTPTESLASLAGTTLRLKDGSVLNVKGGDR